MSRSPPKRLLGTHVAFGWGSKSWIGSIAAETVSITGGRFEGFFVPARHYE